MLVAELKSMLTSYIDGHRELRGRGGSSGRSDGGWRRSWRSGVERRRHGRGIGDGRDARDCHSRTARGRC